MNVSDSDRTAAALEKIGFHHEPQIEQADVIVLNTCVVRQSAENKAYGRLQSLRPVKQKRPEVVICLMGCLVGVKTTQHLQKKLPFVNVFAPPSDPGPLVAYLSQGEVQQAELDNDQQRFAWMDEASLGEVPLPSEARGKTISAYIPVVYGCSHACSFCIIPYRRGIEHSRSPEQIIGEARSMAAVGVKEITLLGQIVDRYGLDQPNYPRLDGLLRQLNEIDGLLRLRFLTSHPNWMTDELLDTVAELPKVCRHIEVPIQAGDDDVLLAMRRGYTVDQYRRLVEKIRVKIPGVSIATDIIVGFPGETDEKFQKTYDLLAELKLDVAHLARYSPRPGTVSARQLTDDVSDEEKMSRFRALETLQETIITEINSHLLGTRVDVLFEEKVKHRWKGRTATNRLVFVETDANLMGQLLPVDITWTGPWSLIGELRADKP